MLVEEEKTTLLLCASREEFRAQFLLCPQFPMVHMTQRMPRRYHHKGDDEMAERRGKGVKHTEKSWVHSYQKTKVRKKTHQQLLQQSLCSDRCPMPSGREAQRGEVNAAAAFSLNFYAALLPSKVMHDPPRTNFLALTASNSTIPVPPKWSKDTRNCSGEQEVGGKSCRKNSSLNSVILTQKESHWSLDGRRCSMDCAGLSVTTQLQTHKELPHFLY